MNPGKMNDDVPRKKAYVYHISYRRAYKKKNLDKKVGRCRKNWAGEHLRDGISDTYNQLEFWKEIKNAGSSEPRNSSFKLGLDQFDGWRKQAADKRIDKTVP